MGVTQDKRNGGGCSDTLAKGVLIMEIMQMILIIAFTALLVELIKNIKKPANTCQEFFEKSLKFIELNFFAQ